MNSGSCDYSCMKEGTRSDEAVEDYQQMAVPLSLTELFSFFQLIVLILW